MLKAHQVLKVLVSILFSSEAIKAICASSQFSLADFDQVVGLSTMQQHLCRFWHEVSLETMALSEATHLKSHFFKLAIE